MKIIIWKDLNVNEYKNQRREKWSSNYFNLNQLSPLCVKEMNVKNFTNRNVIFVHNISENLLIFYSQNMRLQFIIFE